MKIGIVHFVPAISLIIGGLVKAEVPTNTGRWAGSSQHVVIQNNMPAACDAPLMSAIGTVNGVGAIWEFIHSSTDFSTSYDTQIDTGLTQIEDGVLPSDVPAQTVLKYSDSTETTIIGTATRINRNELFYGPDNSGDFSCTGPLGLAQLDYQSIITHELGHVIGLNHVSDPSEVMYPYVDRGSTKYYFQPDEQYKIQSLYP